MPESTVEIRAEQSREWDAWTGTPQDLLRLASELERVHQPERTAALDKTKQLPETSSTTLSGLAADLRRIQEESHQVQLSVEEIRPDRTVTGSPAEVLAEVDPRNVVSASLHSPLSASISISIRFWHYGCSLKVTGNDTRTVRVTLDDLASRIKTNIPRWGLLRSVWAAPLYGLLAAGIFLTLMWPVETGSGPNGTTISDVLTALIYVGLIGSFVLTTLMRKLLPGFELVGPAGKARSQQFLGFMRTLAVLVAGALLGVLFDRML